MKLSIITINRNNAEGLRKTIESVVSQTFTDFEYIIIDGASTDGSVDIIKEYAGKIDYWVSEPDKGIYNAMNKGIMKAKGEYLLFLNSGDWLVDEGVVEDFYYCKFQEDIIIGNINLWDNGKVTFLQTKNKDEFGFEHFYFGGSLPHQATFTKKKLFELYGLYNENYKIASDFEFFVITLLTKGAHYCHFERIISNYDLSGLSSQMANDELHQAERIDVFMKHVPLMYKSYKKACDAVDKLDYYEFYFREYMNLKNGKTSWIINFLLWTKKKLKSIK